MHNQKKLTIQKQDGHWGTIVKSKIKIIKKYSGENVLDVGCSSGDYVFYLNNNGFNTFGCDISKDTSWKKDSSKFKIGSIYKLPFADKSFDTVLALEILEHLEKPSLALKEISRIAKKNVIISIPNCELPPVFNYSGLSFYHHIDKTHINRFTEKDIKEILMKHGYQIDLLSKISPIRPEVLFLYTLYFPLSLAKFIGKVISRIAINRKIYSDIIIVASIKH